MAGIATKPLCMMMQSLHAPAAIYVVIVNGMDMSMLWHPAWTFTVVLRMRIPTFYLNRYKKHLLGKYYLMPSRIHVKNLSMSVMTKFIKCTIFLYGVVLWAAVLVQIDLFEILKKLSFFVCLI